MATTLRAAAQDQNVRFPLFDHNPIWDKSINSKFVRVMNVAAQLAESFFKTIANIGLRALNGVHSVLFGSRKAETVTAAASSRVSTVNAVKINHKKSIPTEATKESWMRTAGKVVLWTTLGIVVIGSIAWGINKMGYCPPGFSYFCEKTPDAIRAHSSYKPTFETARGTLASTQALLETYKGTRINNVQALVHSTVVSFKSVTEAETCINAARTVADTTACKADTAIEIFNLWATIAKQEAMG